MPVDYRLDLKRRLIVTTGAGRVTFDEIKDHQDRLMNDAAFDATFHQLIDVTAATSLDISADEARRVADRPIVAPTSARAFVAWAPVMYGIGRLMQVYHERHAPVQVFRDRKSALEWLGIEEDVTFTETPPG